MSFSAGLHTQLAAVMESLVHAAVAELKKLVEAGEEPTVLARERTESRERMVRSGDCLVWRCNWLPSVAGVAM